MHDLVNVPYDPAYGSINSAVNGLCLAIELQDGFEQYHFTFDPDDQYRLIVFNPAYRKLVGRHLCVDHEQPNAPLRELLQWHFRQAVLANVYQEGTATFDYNLTNGRNRPIGLYLDGPLPQERMTFEIANRLGASTDVSDMEIIK